MSNFDMFMTYLTTNFLTVWFTSTQGFLVYSYHVKFVVFWWTSNIFYSNKLCFYLFFKILRNMLYRGSEVSAQNQKVQPFCHNFHQLQCHSKVSFHLSSCFLRDESLISRAFNYLIKQEASKMTLNKFWFVMFFITDNERSCLGSVWWNSLHER